LVDRTHNSMIDNNSESTSCVLFLQTDDTFAEPATLALNEAGFTTLIVKDLDRALQQIIQLKPAMVAIDRTRTAESGLKFCRQLRNLGSRTVILMLVDEETVNERVAILEAGADDYLLKPYNKANFLNLVHLYLQPTTHPKEQLRFGDLVLDLTTRQVLRKEGAIELTMKEFELLKYLMSNPHRVLTREEILEHVWSYDYKGESNVIEVYIRYLRLKIEGEGQKRLIQTVRGVGYVLRES
jgi:two-component system, OmpR family, response regulator NblR